MRILLDENLPRQLVAALRAEGQVVESANTLRMQGVANAKLYEFAILNFEVCFTRDFGFAGQIRQSPPPATSRLFCVTLPTKPPAEFVRNFVAAFRASHFDRLPHSGEWP